MTPPRIYEIHTLAWLDALSARRGAPVTLAGVPDSELDALADLGPDAVWLMGIWERSPAGREIALSHPGLQNDYARALPSFGPTDITGSPYAVRRYFVDPAAGSREDLASFRRRLASRGMKLFLDFVPNHVAPDHPWLTESPDCLLTASEADLARDPDTFFRHPTTGRIFAHGKDPYFPAWTDTVQVNAFHPALRERVIATLLNIASQCDGVRCDMAMLLTTPVFSRTWGPLAGAPPGEDYWLAVLPSIQRVYPDFQLIAEVYWDMEYTLMQQGFHFAYDKRLYDRMCHEGAAAIRGHLHADLAYQSRLVRFIENHDEPRAATALGPARSRAAAVLVLTLPGAALLHEGQELGHRTKLPVQLHRRPTEPDDLPLRAFYRTLLSASRAPAFREGTFSLREALPISPRSAEHRGLIAFTRAHGPELRLVVVNWSPEYGQARIPLPDLGLAGKPLRLTDALTGETYARSGDEVSTAGLHVLLPPWGAHLFSIDA
ncbi:MAG: alpha-amylase family glycosyl hydrolase [Polyangiaceae bacterium]